MATGKGDPRLAPARSLLLASGAGQLWPRSLPVQRKRPLLLPIQQHVPLPHAPKRNRHHSRHQLQRGRPVQISW